MQNFEKKKLQKENNYSVGSGDNITCAKLGFQNFQILAAGDDQKNVKLWKITKTKPKLTLSGHTTNVSTIGFDTRAEHLYAGTEGGSVYIWNLGTQQPTILQGHKTTITSIAHEEQQSVIATASADSNVKVWDTRASNTNAILTFQQHDDVVKDIAISPDGRWISSGGIGGLVKIWELDTGKVVYELPQHPSGSKQSVNCIEYNPQTLTMACGSTDKTVKYWDLESFQNICCTSKDTSEIQHMSFYEENADLLFSASNDHIRLWNVETNKQLDCLSLPPKTITDVKVAPDSGESGLLLVSAIQANTISMYFSHLNNLNFDESIDMLPTNIQGDNQKSQEQDVIMMKKPSSEDVSDNIDTRLDVPDLKDNEEEQENDNQRMTYIQAPRDEPVNLDMSSFDKQGAQPDIANAEDQEKKDIEIINECMERHTTFNGVMQRRSANIKVVLNYIVKQNNLGSALNALNMIKDPTVSMDILNFTFAKKKRLDMLNFERVIQLMPHVQDLIDSKYETHMKAGLKSALNVLQAFSTSVINMKNSNSQGRGVDLAREDRIAKCDGVIDSFFQLSKSKSFHKCMKRGGEVAQISTRLNSELQSFIDKTKGELC